MLIEQNDWRFENISHEPLTSLWHQDRSGSGVRAQSALYFEPSSFTSRYVSRVVLTSPPRQTSLRQLASVPLGFLFDLWFGRLTLNRQRTKITTIEVR